jgi:hypothetical protein
MRSFLLLALLSLAILPLGVDAQTPPPAGQNPSPMVEHTRAHERLSRVDIGGMRTTFTGPQQKPVDVWVPSSASRSDSIDLVVHFLGEAWLPEYAVARLGANTAAAVINIGAGSGIYDRSFSSPAAFDSLLANISRCVDSLRGRHLGIRRITLSGFSAGHGAIRAILRDQRHFDQVNAILLMDGMHTSYIPEGVPIEKGGALDPENLEAFLRFARAAVRGEKQFLITHSEIFPGTFASTTETADCLLDSLGLVRKPTVAWGPRGMQQLGMVRRGGFELLSFAGNSAPDHIDHLHGMPEFLAQLGAIREE